MKKALNLLLLMLISAVAASAQAQVPAAGAGDAPGLSVTQYKWRQEVRNPALDEDPLSVNDEHQQLLRAQRETRRANVVRERSGQAPIPPPTRTGAQPINVEDGEQTALRRVARRADDPGGLTVNYFYEVNVSNTGEKAIRALVWEYVLFDTDTKLEVGRRRFVNEASIKPGKSKKLVGQSSFPPANTVDASKAGKQTRNQFAESVVIVRVEYADGSAWERPAAN